MKTCTGNSRSAAAAEPSWWGQLETQLQDVSDTVGEINDPSLEEGFAAFDTLVADRFRASHKTEK